MRVVASVGGCQCSMAHLRVDDDEAVALLGEQIVDELLPEDIHNAVAHHSRHGHVPRARDAAARVVPALAAVDEDGLALSVQAHRLLDSHPALFGLPINPFWILYQA